MFDYIEDDMTPFERETWERWRTRSLMARSALRLLAMMETIP